MQCNAMQRNGIKGRSKAQRDKKVRPPIQKIQESKKKKKDALSNTLYISIAQAHRAHSIRTNSDTTLVMFVQQ